MLALRTFLLISLTGGSFIQAADPVLSAVVGTGASALQSSNLLNPNISVVGWFQGMAGHPHNPGVDAEPAFQLKETELALQAIVDSWARADFFVSFDHEGSASLEEGYITWFHLPAGLGLRTGKFRSYFGPFNRTHPHDTPFATRPLSEKNFLGEDGLAGTGAGLSWQIPIPWLYVNTEVEAMRPPSVDDTPSFDRAQRKDLLYVGRVNSYVDLSDSQNLSFGGSYANGSSGQELDAAGLSSTTLRTQLYALDFTYRWKNPARAIYRSLLWQNEILWSRHEVTTTEAVQSWGLMSWLEYQFLQRWSMGGRYDYSQFATDDRLHEAGGLLFLTFSPSEFTRISLQGSHVRRSDGRDENLGLLKLTFNIGPHGAHPF